MRSSTSSLLVLSALGVLAAPSVARAQSAIIYGSVTNFDISNDTGRVCNGFEIQMDGSTTNQAPFSFNAERYGTPSSYAYAGGMAVRWAAPFDAVSQTYATRTLPHTVPWFPGQCYQWNPLTYQDSGCEHFGTARGPAEPITSIRAYWLCDDPANPGTLAPFGAPTSVPFPAYFIAPPAQPALPPQVVMEIQPPPPPPPPPAPVPQFADATWIRVFVNEMPREVGLDELLVDNPAVVPMDPAQAETNWDLLQPDPPSLPASGSHSKKQLGRDVKATTRSVVRRIETWQFTGAYDAVNHAAICADGTCTAPAVGEVGAIISTQMSAVNVQADTLTATKIGTGGGNVDSSDKRISCGSKCVSPYNAGTAVTLTAKANSGSVFAGWTGACSGTSTTCTVSINGHTEAIATFTAQAGGGGGGGGGGSSGPTLSVKTAGGRGTIVSAPAGINCGSVCSAQVAAGTAVTLTVTPDAGLHFVSWSGACTGTSPTCTTTVNASGTAQANLSK
jgi:uncharacterized repeat protein (TIGR02543 family)